MRTLQIAHNHPRFYPGGTELVAMELHRSALAAGGDSWFLGAVDGEHRAQNPGTNMIGLDDEHREAVIFVPMFDRFQLAQPDSHGALREFREYLQWLRPGAVHIHHLLNLGLEALFVIRDTLPEAQVTLTLHDYYLVCANHGQLYRHDMAARCEGPSIERCTACIGGRTAIDFAMRRTDVAHAMSLVDRITAPSTFLKRMVASAAAWGERIEVVANPYVGPRETAPPPRYRGPGDPVTFGYFGNLSRVKGILDLLAAARLLVERGRTGFDLRVHGAQLSPDPALAEGIAAHAAALGPRLTMHGGYRPDEMPRLMAPVDAVVFPSIWVENAPLVLAEARHHARPVIAYPHGAAPEFLQDPGAGVIAERSDPRALADAMERVMDGGGAGQRSVDNLESPA